MSAGPGGPRERGGALPTLAVLAVVLALWELWLRIRGSPPLYLPPPHRVARRLFMSLTQGDLLADLAITLRRLASGAALGALPALALGLAMGWSRRVRRLVDPLVAALHPLPKVALLPLLLLLFGVGESSRLVLIAIGAFFPMLVAAMAGVSEIPATHFEVARSFGARRALVLRRIVLPGSLPLVFAGARLSLNAALLATLVAELLTSRDGLGERLWLAWQTLRVDELYATLVVVALVGLALQGGLEFAARRLLPWRDEAPPPR